MFVNVENTNPVSSAHISFSPRKTVEKLGWNFHLYHIYTWPWTMFVLHCLTDTCITVSKEKIFHKSHAMHWMPHMLNWFKEKVLWNILTKLFFIDIDCIKQHNATPRNFSSWSYKRSGEKCQEWNKLNERRFWWNP